MRHKIKQHTYYLGIFIFLFSLIFESNLLAADLPQTIRIGLESVYKNVQKIDIHSQDNLLIGYFESNRFQIEGILPSAHIYVVKPSTTYYTDGNVYFTFDEAQQAAERNNVQAFPAYLSKGNYAVYSLMDTGALYPVTNLNKVAEVQDEVGQVIMVCSYEKDPLAFQGSYKEYDFPVTGVGKSRKYRGAIEITSTGNNSGLTPVNVVSIEDYLYGVVPAEMPSSWPKEALKAQAVASRSIAYTQFNRFLDRGYNVLDSTVTQMYLGVTAETPLTNLAVDETAGETARYSGKPAETVFFSTSGGYTEDAYNVWGNEVPYLKAVPDLFETTPAQAPWTRTITLAEVDQCLKQSGIDIGQTLGVEILSRTSSGRVNELNILGTTGNYKVAKENVRTFFSSTKEGSLKSRLFGFNEVLGMSSLQTTSKASQGKNITLMSADDICTVGLEDIMIISSQGRTQAKNKLTIQSSNTVLEMGEEKAESPVSVEGQQVVYGDFTIFGRGYGHGVGMSQSGARGMAEAGYSYKDILQYYYQGITVER